jgi:tagaturonate epimerase
MKNQVGLSEYSLGVGDRFAHQALAQLEACCKAWRQGAHITPVWNKSNREHVLVGSEPSSVRAAALAAVKTLDWVHPYFIDADHIRLETVDRFIGACDFFTLDVADSIGKSIDSRLTQAFVNRHPELTRRLEVPGLDQPLTITPAEVERIAGKYLLATREAGKIYRHLAQAKGDGAMIIEVSMDEADQPQRPPELLVILAALADEQIPVHTLAPKFTGRFNKGVDYVGDVAQFEREFNDDLCILAQAAKSYGLPSTLKLSIHSGSDKFSLYPAVRRVLAKHHAGAHLKTAGTTWLEECLGLAESGGAGLELIKEIYADAVLEIDELCAPYATVIDINRSRLPAVATVKSWTSEQFVSALDHDPQHPAFNPHLRQLMHVAYKVAARMGDRFLEQLEACEATISRRVTANLYDRHIRPLFL